MQNVNSPQNINYGQQYRDVNSNNSNQFQMQPNLIPSMQNNNSSQNTNYGQQWHDNRVNQTQQIQQGNVHITHVNQTFQQAPVYVAPQPVRYEQTVLVKPRRRKYSNCCICCTGTVIVVVIIIVISVSVGVTQSSSTTYVDNGGNNNDPLTTRYPPILQSSTKSSNSSSVGSSSSSRSTSKISISTATITTTADYTNFTTIAANSSTAANVGLTTDQLMIKGKMPLNGAEKVNMFDECPFKQRNKWETA